MNELKIGLQFIVITLSIFISQPLFSAELHNAAVSGDLVQIKKLLSTGYDIESLDSEPTSAHEWPKGTALHWAAKSGKISVVKYLIDTGANLNTRTYAGDCMVVETPLDYALWNGQKEIVVMLLDAGADVESAGHNFHWPLQIAASMGAIDLAEILLQHGAHINRSGVDGYSALHHAVLDNQPQSVEFLLRKGADANYRDEKFGEHAQTPLQLAKANKSEQIVRILLQYGAQ